MTGNTWRLVRGRSLARKRGSPLAPGEWDDLSERLPGGLRRVEAGQVQQTATTGPHTADQRPPTADLDLDSVAAEAEVRNEIF